MSIGSDILNKSMNYLASKSLMISSNISGANSPGYKRRSPSLDFRQYIKSVPSLKMKVTHQFHIASPLRRRNALPYQQRGSVDLQKEMMDLNDASTQYNIASGIYSKMTKLLTLSVK